MPLYEFNCPTCGSDFEELVRSAEAVKDVTCPDCGSRRVRKKLSTFASRVSGGSQKASLPGAASCAPGGT